MFNKKQTKVRYLRVETTSIPGRNSVYSEHYLTIVAEFGNSEWCTNNSKEEVRRGKTHITRQMQCYPRALLINKRSEKLTQVNIHKQRQ